MTQAITEASLKCLGYAKYTTTGSAFSLSTAPDAGSALPKNARIARLQAETQNIRFRADATNPDSTTGVLILAGGPGEIAISELQDLRFIAAVGGAILHVMYYR